MTGVLLFSFSLLLGRQNGDVRFLFLVSLLLGKQDGDAVWNSVGSYLYARAIFGTQWEVKIEGRKGKRMEKCNSKFMWLKIQFFNLKFYFIFCTSLEEVKNFKTVGWFSQWKTPWGV